MSLGPQFDMSRQPKMGVNQTDDETVESMRMRGYDVNRGTHGTTWTEQNLNQDVVLPGAAVGKTNFDAVSHVDRAYYTAKHAKDDSPDDYYQQGQSADARGWAWANRAAEKLDVNSDRHAITGEAVRARPVVHDVEPIGHLAGDPVLNPGGKSSAEMTADKLRILDTHWIPSPVNTYGHVLGFQGTLPKANWNRWGNGDSFSDHNVAAVEQESPRRKRQRSYINETQRAQAANRQIPGQLKLPNA